jgi:hypothetical protein
MKKTSYTPGPWNYEEWEDGQWEVEPPIDQQRIGDPCGGYKIANCPGPQAQANARLIAAAPEMLEMLQRLFRIMSVDYAKTRPDVLEQVNGLIQKALGE